jgi:hypothetical protein
VVAVEHVGVEVDSVRPADRSSDVVDLDLAEDARIPKWLEYTALEQSIEVQFPDEAVGEGQAKAEVPEVLDVDDPGQLTHRSSLLKGLDREQRLGHLGPLPILDQFAPAEVSAFADETLRHAGQAAFNDGSVRDAHPSLVPAIEGVDVRRTVVPPVHVDHDAVELR